MNILFILNESNIKIGIKRWMVNNNSGVNSWE